MNELINGWNCLIRDEDAPAQIPDEAAVKPDGWLDDEPEYIGDPSAVRPDDWLVEAPEMSADTCWHMMDWTLCISCP